MAISHAGPGQKIAIPLTAWFGPQDGGGISGGYALAFQKVFLEGDTRWKPLLLTKPSSNATLITNIR